MPFRGGSLVDLFSESTVGPPTTRLLRNVADAAGEAMTTAAVTHTPKRTGEVAASWRKLPVIKTERGFESGTENRHWRARWVEYGVAPHEITPKRAKALGLPDGPRGGAHHPGHPGAHVTARAAAEVEGSLDEIAAPSLSRWQAEVEHRAKRHPGIQ